jgi:hypothetical protein
VVISTIFCRFVSHRLFSISNAAASINELMQPATLSKNGNLGIGSCGLSLYSIGWKSSSVRDSLHKG